MSATLGAIIVDAVDPRALGRFWQRVIGGELRDDGSDTVLSAPGAVLRFRACAESKTVKNRNHPDLYVAAVEPLLDLGAVLLADQSEWVTLADIEGNEFCAFLDAERAGTGAVARLFSVCTDSDRPEELAAWWAALLDAQVEPGPDGTLRWLHGPAGWPELIWKFVQVGDERVTPNRWRWTVRAERGALPAALVDPHGNEFELY
ncbi:VOC family protein [soil metagenome]